MTVALAEINNEPVVPHSNGDDWEIRCGLTLSGVYKTGGDTTFKEKIEAVLKELGTGIIQLAVVNGAPGFYIIYNYKTGKLQVFRSGKEKEGLEELPEEEYPAALREAGLIRCQVFGK